uniref:Uncharacterized protein n=1 Tax=viral metagenome TaxID=1070528 RepID=A0A6C0AD27_9ZZZZ
MGGRQSDLNVDHKTKISDFKAILKSLSLGYIKIYSPDINIKIYLVTLGEKYGNIHLKYTFDNNIIYNISKTYDRKPYEKSENDYFRIITLKKGENIESLIDKSTDFFEKINENTYKINDIKYEKIKDSNLIEDVYYID